MVWFHFPVCPSLLSQKTNRATLTMAHHGTPTPWQSTSGHGTAHRLVRRIKNPFQTFFCTLLLYFIMVSLLSAELHRNGAFSVFNVREWIVSIKVKEFTCLRFPTSLVASSLTSLASHSTSHCKSVTGPLSSWKAVTDKCQRCHWQIRRQVLVSLEIEWSVVHPVSPASDDLKFGKVFLCETHTGVSS